jgi:hypothetical protein
LIAFGGNLVPRSTQTHLFQHDETASPYKEMNRLGINQGREPTDPAQEGPWEAKCDAFNEQTVNGLRQWVSQELLNKARIGTPLIELLENDFHKLTPKQP